MTPEPTVDPRVTAAITLDHSMMFVRKAVAAWLVAVFLLLASGVAYNSYEDHGTNSVANVIRSVQVTNTVHTDCESRALDAALADAKLAISGDSNAADYATAPHCSSITPKPKK
jgi:hypothetical protein